MILRDGIMHQSIDKTRVASISRDGASARRSLSRRLNDRFADMFVELEYLIPLNAVGKPSFSSEVCACARLAGKAPIRGAGVRLPADVGPAPPASGLRRQSSSRHGNDANGQLQLYNLRADQSEQRDLSQDQPQTTIELWARLADLRKISGVSR